MKKYVDVTGVTGLGLSWTEIRTQCAGRSQTGVSIWMAQGTPGSGVVTATLASAPNNAVIIVSRYAGANPDNPIGSIVSGNTNGQDGLCDGGSDGPSYSFPITASINNAMIFGAAAMRNKTHTPGAGYTEREETVAGSGGSTASLVVVDATIETASTVDFLGDFSSAVDWAAVGVEILAGAAPDAPEITLTPASHDFGGLIINNTTSNTFEVRNDGSADLNVSGISLIGTDASEFSITDDSPFTLAPAETRNIEVNFNPIAVGAKSATLQIINDDSDENPLDIALSGNALPIPAPDISANPASHDYGDEFIGNNVSHTFAIKNNGSATLEVSGSSITGTNASEFAFTGSSGPFSIAPGDSAEVEIAFNPATEGGKSAIWQISSDDPDSPTLDVALTANALAPSPDITVTPAAHDYGSVLLNVSPSTTFTIRNDGVAALNVSATNLSGTDPAAFNVESGGGSFTLAPGEEQDVEVGFTPTSETSYSAVLQISSDDPDESSLDIALSGIGISEPPPALEVTFIETLSGASSSSATVATAASMTGDPGDLFLAAISMKPYRDINSVSGLGLTWTEVRTQCAGRSQTGVSIWMAQGTPGSGVVEATLASAPNNAVIIVSRYAGANPDNPIGSIVSGNTNGQDGLCDGGSDGPSYSFPITASINNAMIFGAAAMRNKTHTPGAGYTEREETVAGSGGSAAGLAVVDTTIETASTVNFLGDFSSNVDWAAVGVEILAGSSGSPSKTALKLKDSEKGLDGHTSETGNQVVSILELNHLDAAAVTAPVLPEALALSPNYPNPFNPSTTIRYALPNAAAVDARIYNVIGQQVRSLVQENQSAGFKQIVWDGKGDAGNQVGSGIYFLHLIVDQRRLVQKMLLQK